MGRSCRAFSISIICIAVQALVILPHGELACTSRWFGLVLALAVLNDLGLTVPAFVVLLRVS